MVYADRQTWAANVALDQTTQNPERWSGSQGAFVLESIFTIADVSAVWCRKTSLHISL